MSQLCSTCLSVDRKVIPIKKIRNKQIFLDWFGKIKLENLKICWECKAMFSKIYNFKNQVFVAQKISFRVAHKKLRDIISLTNLSTYTKRTFDRVFIHETDIPVASNDLTTMEDLKKDDVNNNTKILKRQENSKTEVVKEMPKNKEKQNSNNNNDSKFKNKRKCDNNSDDGQFTKKSKEEKDSNATNIGSNIGAEQPTKTNKQKSDATEKKILVLRLSEEKMMKAREKDRNAPNYKTRPYKCEKCIIGYIEKKQLEKHVFEKHTDFPGQLVCPICDVRFTRKDFFQYHLDCHYRSYKCTLCRFEDHRRFVIDAHVTKHGDVSNAGSKSQVIYYHHGIAYKELPKCDQCGETFTNINSLNEHAATHVEKIQTFTCTLCNRLFQDNGSFRAHMQFAHPKPEDCTFCSECNLHFPSLDRYNRHLQESKKHCLFEELPFGCDKCHCKFLNEVYLQRHKVRAHQLTHTCETCDQSFSDSSGLKRHLLEKHDDGTTSKDKISCPCCSKGFYFRSALLSHIRSHTAEKPYQCDQCNKRFAVKYTLKKHVQRRHSADDSN